MTAATDKEPFSLTQIPCSALLRLGAVFREGEPKYGRGNWRRGVHDKDYQIERANHALKHLLWYVHALETGERLGEAEDHLAKVAWFCVTQMELERLEAAAPLPSDVPQASSNGLGQDRRALHWGDIQVSVTGAATPAVLGDRALARQAQPAAASPPMPPPALTIAYSLLSESMRDHIRTTHEPGARWYYSMPDRGVTWQRQHEVEHFEQTNAQALENGSLRRVIDIPGEGQA
jgi:hypothetical protein